MAQIDVGELISGLVQIPTVEEGLKFLLGKVEGVIAAQGPNTQGAITALIEAAAPIAQALMANVVSPNSTPTPTVAPTPADMPATPPAS